MDCDTTRILSSSYLQKVPQPDPILIHILQATEVLFHTKGAFRSEESNSDISLQVLYPDLWQRIQSSGPCTETSSCGVKRLTFALLHCMLLQPTRVRTLKCFLPHTVHHLICSVHAITLPIGQLLEDLILGSIIHCTDWAIILYLAWITQSYKFLKCRTVMMNSLHKAINASSDSLHHKSPHFTGDCHELAHEALIILGFSDEKRTEFFASFQFLSSRTNGCDLSIATLFNTVSSPPRAQTYGAYHLFENPSSPSSVYIFPKQRDDTPVFVVQHTTEDISAASSLANKAHNFDDDANMDIVKMFTTCFLQNTQNAGRLVTRWLLDPKKIFSLQRSPTTGHHSWIQIMCNSNHMLRRRLFVRQILWSNASNLSECVGCLLSMHDAFFLPEASHSLCHDGAEEQKEVHEWKERSTFSLSLNVLCILEEFLSIELQCTNGWYSESSEQQGTHSPHHQANPSKFWMIILLLRLSQLPNGKGGDIASFTLLHAISYMYRHIMLLDVTLVHRLRHLVVHLGQSYAFEMPWSLWYEMCTDYSDSRLGVCRKLFLHEILSDMTVRSFSRRVLRAVPEEIHALVPRTPRRGARDSFRRLASLEKILGSKNMSMLKNVMFRLRDLYSPNVDCDASESAHIQLMHSILCESEVSLCYQRELLHFSRDIFSELDLSLYEQLNQRTDLERGILKEGKRVSILHFKIYVELLNHILTFWKGNSAARFHTFCNVIKSGVCRPIHIALWLEQPEIVQIWEQSWITDVLVYAIDHVLRPSVENISEAGSLCASNTREISTSEASYVHAKWEYEVRVFFLVSLQALCQHISTACCTEKAEVKKIMESSHGKEGMNPKWHTKNVVWLRGAVGMVRILLRSAHNNCIAARLPSLSACLRDIVFIEGSTNDFLIIMFMEVFAPQKLLYRENNLSERTRTSNLKSTESRKPLICFREFLEYEK